MKEELRYAFADESESARRKQAKQPRPVASLHSMMTQVRADKCL